MQRGTKARRRIGRRLYGFTQGVFDDPPRADRDAQTMLVREMAGWYLQIAEKVGRQQSRPTAGRDRRLVSPRRRQDASGVDL